MSVVWGILSTARINDWILEATRDARSMRFAAVASRDKDRSSAWAAERNIERSYGAYADLLDAPDIDAVYISLPNALHVEWSIRALEAGKHVLCEKPLGRDPGQVEHAAEIARQRGLVLAEAFMYRYHPQTARARELLAAGAIGELRHINATLSFQIETRDRDVRLSPQLEGGALMDTGCYCVSAMRLLAGEPEAVYGQYVRDDGGVDLRATGVLRFPGGVTGQFDAAMTLPRRDRVEIVGSSGSLVLDDPWHCRTRVIRLLTPDVPSYGPPHPNDGLTEVVVDPDGLLGTTGQLYDAYRFELEAVTQAIATGVQPEFAGADAVAQARVLAALHESAVADAPVRLDGKGIARLATDPGS